jgi:hypothetical protein
MSARKRSSNLNNLNNLNTSLHSIISGSASEHEANIPFADDEDNPPIDKTNGKSSDSISSNESYPEKVNYNPGRRVQLVDRKNYRGNTGNEASGESDTDDGRALALEKRDRPGPLLSETQRVTETSNLGVLRRNSISMPVLNENDLDALRGLHMKACESTDNESHESHESLEKITVSSTSLKIFSSRYRIHDTIVLIILVSVMTTSTSLDKRKSSCN